MLGELGKEAPELGEAAPKLIYYFKHSHVDAFRLVKNGEANREDRAPTMGWGPPYNRAGSPSLMTYFLG
jgi:hypothetical protein